MYKVTKNHLRKLYPDGSIQFERYGEIRYIGPNLDMPWVGISHRLDGPAQIDYNKKGKICKWAWHINGERINREIIRKYFVDPINPTKEEIMLFKLAEL